MAATVIGLIAFLPSGGITAAAIVSSASYALIFVASLVAYRALARLPWGALAADARAAAGAGALRAQ